MWRLGPAAWTRHPKLSEGQGLFRGTGSSVSSGHLAVGTPWACPRELTFSVAGSPAQCPGPNHGISHPCREGRASLVRRGPLQRGTCVSFTPQRAEAGAAWGCG